MTHPTADDELREARADAAIWKRSAADRLLERDKLVEAIGRLVSLPPHLVARAYGVSYSGHFTQPLALAGEQRLLGAVQHAQTEPS